MNLYDNDAYRDTFMEGVYDLLEDDPTNERANAIIELFDKAPSVTIPENEPLTQTDLDKMDYDKVWIDYGNENCGEWALVVGGRIYSIDTLEGCGMEDIFRDEVKGETLDYPTGKYTVYRRPPEGEVDRT